jgi:phosphate:Na+ symporter
MNNPLVSLDLWAGLFGGLALFLFGMDIMTKALKRATGDYMKDILAKLTRNRFVAMGTGALITSIIQSSSVTTVILVGFISAGLMSMTQSVAVIIGANIGTTITAQILAFKVSALALPIIAVGFGLSFTSKKEQLRQIGLLLLGLGLVFYGMSVMSGAMKPLRSYQPFIDFMLTLDNPFLAVLVGAFFTAIVQSSSATTGILIVMAGQGLIGLEAAIAIALGANIGTCVTAGLAAIGKPREALRAAAVHTLFNVVGVLMWIAFIPQLADIARFISPASTGLNGVVDLAIDAPRQIANVHTFFNIINAFLFIGFTTQIARFIEWLIPDRPLKEMPRYKAKFLDETLVSTPSIALDNARREIGRLGKLVCEMLDDAMPKAITGTPADLSNLEKQDRNVDLLHRDIVEYLGKISVNDLTHSQSIKLMGLIQVVNDLERMGDRIAIDLVISSRKRLKKGIKVSDPTQKIIVRFHHEVAKAVSGAIEAVVNEDKKRARQVQNMKRNLATMAEEIALHQVARLTVNAPKRLSTYAREIELVEILDSIFKIARRIARIQIKISKKQNGVDVTDRQAVG